MSTEQNENSDQQKPKKQITDDNWEVIIRNYPKVIFMWPVALTSLILWILQWIMMENGGEPDPILANIWLWMFFANLFITEFEIGSAKFFAILLGVILIALAIFIWGMPTIPDLNIQLQPAFYGVMFAITTLCILIAFIETRFDYWKLEKNELIHRTGLFPNLKRYPTQRLRYKKEINDIFEFLIFGSGQITLYLEGTEPVVLPTVVRINKVAEKLDALLSQFRVRVID